MKTRTKNLFLGAALVAGLGLMPAASAHAGAVFTSLYSFTGTNDGANPRAALVQGSDGNFYGTTDWGGTNNLGTVFKITTAGALTSLYSFTGVNDGANPLAGLVEGSDGNFYGTTDSGGTNNFGTVFKITANGALASLYSFTGGGDGANPLAGLVQCSDGYFYGTTVGGGSTGLGSVFRISTTGTLTNLYSFTGGSDGAYPLAGLAQGSDGNLYGTTGGHGPFFYPCAVFKISTDGGLTNLYTFGAPWFEQPNGLVQGTYGNFYGTTFGGGTYGNGSVFNISTNGALTNLYSFSGGNNGGLPQAALVQGSDGNFYGTTAIGGKTNFNPEIGAYGFGTVFKISTNGMLTSLYSFGGTNDGDNPRAAPVQGRDGSFYGTTEYGGTNNLGTIFRLTMEPELAITVSGANVILSWPTNAAGFTLEFATNLDSPMVWSASLTNQGVIGRQSVATNPISGSQMFFRLKH